MALGPGSIAFTGFNADGTDSLAFVALEEIPAGTVIVFEDNEWNGAAFADTNENAFSWTAPGTAVAAGTVIVLGSVSTPASATANIGTVAAVAGRGTNAGISGGDEVVYAYSGTALAPTFLTAVANGGYSAANGLLTGTGLTAGTNALDLGPLDDDADIAAFTGLRSGQASFADYRPILNTSTANWVAQDGSGDQSADGTAPDVPFSDAIFTAGGGAVAGSVSVNDVSVVEGDAGTKTVTFTLTRSGGTLAFDVNAATADGTATAGADYVALPATPISFATGQNTRTVSVTVNGDTTFEGPETFDLVLSGATAGATIADGTGVATIRDDELDPATGITILPLAPSLQGTGTPAATDAVQIERVGSFSTPGGNAEAVTFDPTTDRIYATNALLKRVDIVQVGPDGSLTSVGAIPLGGRPDFGTINSVSAKNGVVAVAYDNVTLGQPGTVLLFGPNGGAPLRELTVGVLPDQLVFTPDGQKLLAANEAEAVSAGNNPAGSISVIDLSGGAASATVTATVGFGALSGQEPALQGAGLALFPGQAAAADIEPEYITVSPDGSRAYVTLQEVNAVAVIDVNNPGDRPLAILPLGGVDRNLAGNAFDGNDNGQIQLVNAPITGLLQPDSIASFATGGFTYFIAANEGDSRVGGLTDVARLNAVTLDPTAFPNAAALQNNTTGLGRLQVLTNIGDTDGDGDLDQLFTQGGRSISIFRDNGDGTITKVRETGGEFEAIIAANFASRFNIDGSENGAFDTRSDNKGPEPEAVAVGAIGDRLYAFAGLERTGGYMVYDVTDPANASFVRYQPQLGDPRTGPETAPEVLAFVGAADSPTGTALLITANEVGGTLTVDTVLRPTTGTGAGETLTGDDVVNVLAGASGNDVVHGLGGNDRLFGDAGLDTVLGGTGADTIDGGADDDLVFGEAGNDVLQGGSGGSNQLFGGADSDTVDFGDVAGALFVDLRGQVATIGGVLTDSLNSIENVTGGTGPATLIGDDGANTLRGGSGTDELQGLGGDDVLSGGTAAAGQYNQLFGGEGSDTASYAGLGVAIEASLADFQARRAGVVVDTFSSIENLVGGLGADTLSGDDGANRITGGGGKDALFGRGGADTFVFAGADSRIETAYDTIGDFVGGAGGDRIDLSAFGIDASRVTILSDASSTVLYADVDLATAGFEVGIAFIGAGVVTTGDIIF